MILQDFTNFVFVRHKFREILQDHFQYLARYVDTQEYALNRQRKSNQRDIFSLEAPRKTEQKTITCVGYTLGIGLRSRP